MNTFNVRDMLSSKPIYKLTIKDFQNICLYCAVDRGWDEKEIPIPEQIALIHSEVSEALEAFRNNEPISWRDDKNKPQGLASEYADIMIRVLHYSKLLGINLEKEIVSKLNYNLSRPYRHGGKKI